MTFTRGRRRQVDTTGHFCPHAACAYHGRVGWGISAPMAIPMADDGANWCVCSCQRLFPRDPWHAVHGKQVEPDKLVWAIAALAEGLGIRAVARVFEARSEHGLGLAGARRPITSRPSPAIACATLTSSRCRWTSCSPCSVRSKTARSREAEAIKRLSRSPHWVWVAMDPVCKLLLAVDVGDRTLAMAQRLSIRSRRCWPRTAPRCFSPMGSATYLTALVTHYGQWMQPERRQAKGPRPKPRWMPLPRLLYAQVVKSYRRRRIVGVQHRVIFGAAETIESMLAKHGWKINTAFVERLNLDFRQHVAAIGRRVNTLCKHETGLRQQLALFHVYHNFVLPHASLLRCPCLSSIEGTGGSNSGNHGHRRWPPG